jgi:Domain of unknown function (DUF4390)
MVSIYRRQLKPSLVVASMLRADLTRDGSTRGWLVATVFAIVLTAWSVGFADALDGILEVRSAYVNVDKGVFLLHARVEYPVGPSIRTALHDGVTLSFDLEVRIERDRRFWFNAGIVDVMLRRELTYHAVSDRYVVRDIRSGDVTTFATLNEALDFLGKVDAWPIVVEPQLDGGNYTISVRAGVRRGHLPASLRVILFWTDDWARESEWYTWSLPV